MIRIRTNLFAVVVVLLVTAMSGAWSRAADVPAIRQVTNEAGHPIAVEVTGLPAATMDRLAKLPAKDPAFHRVLIVAVVSESAPGTVVTPMLGAYTVDAKVLRFEPRYPLQPDMRYRATLYPDANKENGAAAASKVSLDINVAANKVPKPAAEVENIYPTASVLPENQLRFYAQFATPMQRGSAYRHLELTDDATGKAVELPFLEIGEELWDPSGRRLTLLIDPGRIKRGLKPREEMGPVLEAGKSYTLTIRPGWRDADGRLLETPFQKKFRAGSPVEERIDPSQWTIQAPAAGTTEPLVVRFPRPLDSALLQHMLWVVDSRKQRVKGTVSVTDAERQWEFRPTGAWSRGEHAIVADTTLEDLAGNSIGRPFEVDVVGDNDQSLKVTTISLPFAVVSNR